MTQREQALYESGIRQQVEAGNEGKIVAIDIEIGKFEVDDTVIAATRQLFKRYPNAKPLGIRIEHRAVYYFDSWSLESIKSLIEESDRGLIISIHTNR